MKRAFTRASGPCQNPVWRGRDAGFGYAPAMATVFLDGRFLNQEDASVSAFDAGLQHGVGLFETMLGGVGNGDEVRVFRLEQHLARLTGSARELGLSHELRAGPLADAVRRTVAESALLRARGRPTHPRGGL